MTKYLFEDKICDRYVLFFMSKYTYTEHTNIYFADDGVSTIIEHLNIISKNYGFINIIVFMDLALFNSTTVREYGRIRKYAASYGGNIIVIPIPCLEYYFIKAYNKIGLGIDQEAISCVLNFTDYKSTDMYLNKIKSIKQKKTWEKFSKMVLKLGFINCFERKDEKSGISYFCRDCVCCDKCNLTFQEKVSLLFKEFNCMPYGVNITEMSAIPINAVYIIHKRLVDKYNSIILNRFDDWVFLDEEGGVVIDYTVEYFPEPKNL